MGILKAPPYPLHNDFFVNRARELYLAVKLFEQVEQV